MSIRANAAVRSIIAQRDAAFDEVERLRERVAFLETSRAVLVIEVERLRAYTRPCGNVGISCDYDLGRQDVQDERDALLAEVERLKLICRRRSDTIVEIVKEREGYLKMLEEK